MISIMKHFSLKFFLLSFIIYSCAPAGKISNYANQFILGDSILKNAHIGIAVYDPETQQYLFQNNADKNFIPASNVKIFSTYVGLKFLGTQLPGILYTENDTALFLTPTGDPTLLHSAFLSQPVASLIKGSNKKIYIHVQEWDTKKFGPGWSWDDYNDDYMPERSPMPIYGNTIKWYQVKTKKENPQSPADTIDTFIYSDPEIEGRVDFGKPSPDGRFRVLRNYSNNDITLFEGKEKYATAEIPFVTDGIQTALQLIRDSLQKELIYMESAHPPAISANFHPLMSRPLDSMLQWMMYHSDNLFAEQTIAISSLMQTGKSNIELFLDSLLRTEFTSLPNKPTWVDGSGLSRYNLFTPRDMVWALDRLEKDFSWERIKNIFPTGGKGTLGGPFVADSARIYAKTGTLSGVTALSGYLITSKNRKLIFSMMVNNHMTSASMIRRRFADFLHACMKRY